MNTRQAAFVLHSRPYRENSSLLTLLTEKDGVQGTIIFSGNSLKSSKKALMQPFLPLTVILSGQGCLKKVQLIEARAKSYLLSGQHLYSGFYLNELMVRLLPENIPCDELFAHYASLLEVLNAKGAIEASLRSFELTLLEELGQSLDFFAAIDTEHEYWGFHPQLGLVPGEQLAKTVNLYPKSLLLALAHRDFSDLRHRQLAKHFMRDVFSPLLGDKPLKSRKLFNKSE